jgi:hypothetical protein
MPPEPPLTFDYWRVNSYGYPNPFAAGAASQGAWQVFLTFVDRADGSYADLKTFWQSNKAPKKLDHAAVESWKAAFEEFGLLYVISRSNKITITPAGRQIIAAAADDNLEEFLWVGINLLLRYPLQGPPRGRPKSAAHGTSDLLLYRFLYSASRDLGDYFWWTELQRIFCRVFSTSEAKSATDAVRYLRANPNEVESFPIPAPASKGGFYNSLNQVVVHAGMNHLLLLQDDTTEHYPASENKRRHTVNRDYLNLIATALGDVPQSGGCATSASYVDRLPAAPILSDEESYFAYLGAPVVTLASLSSISALQTVSLSGDTVFILESDKHFIHVESSKTQNVIKGQIHTLCRIARNHRIILSTDLAWTYLVIDKVAAGTGEILLTLRRARPIVNSEPIQALLGGTDV